VRRGPPRRETSGRIEGMRRARRQAAKGKFEIERGDAERPTAEREEGNLPILKPGALVEKKRASPTFEAEKNQLYGGGGKKKTVGIMKKNLPREKPSSR